LTTRIIFAPGQKFQGIWTKIAIFFAEENQSTACKSTGYDINAFYHSAVIISTSPAKINKNILKISVLKNFCQALFIYF
jgi:hypothetical protein